MNIEYHNREDMVNLSKEFVKPCNVLVDIGCGIRPYIYDNCKIHVCIEPYKEYIDILSSAYKNYNMVFIQNYALEGLKLFPDNSVDTVIMLDFIEHLEKEEGFKILKEADRITRKQIVVFTPLGFVSNDSGNKDNWGLDGIKFQEHKSGWYPEDFGEDWDIHVSNDFYPQKKQKPDDVDFYGCIWAVKNKPDPYIYIYGEKGNEKTPEFVPVEINIRNQMRIEANRASFEKILKKYNKEKYKYQIKRFFINFIPPFCKLQSKLRKKNKEHFKAFLNKIASGCDFH